MLALFLSSCEGPWEDEIPDQRIVHIPDFELLRELIFDGVDTDGDSLISYEEARQLSFINISKYFGPDITDLTGLEAFINLEIFVCRCNRIDTMDLSANTELTEAYIYDNDLKSLNVRGCTKLVRLHVGTEGLCHKNRLSSLDISDCIKLQNLNCSGNQLTEINTSNNPELEILECQMNRIISLDLSCNPGLRILEAWSNQLGEIDLSACEALSTLDFAVNQVSELALSNNPDLKVLDASRNKLSALDISQNQQLELVVLKELPDLLKICVWENPFPPEQLKLVSDPGKVFQYCLHPGPCK